MRKMRTWREYLIEVLADRSEAIGHLQAILEDYQIFGNALVVRDALYTVVEAQGGISELAEQTNMETETLSIALTDEDTPLIDALTTVLKALGYQLSIHPIPTQKENFDIYSDALEEDKSSTQVAENPVPTK